MMHTKLFARILLLTPFLMLWHHVAQAATITTGEAVASFTVKLSEKEAVLMDPDDPTVQKVAMWDHPFQRIADRNMPWIEITNESDSTSQITQFLMTIGDIDFNFSDVHFGDLVMPSDHNPADVGLTASVEPSGPEAGNQLMVNFTGFDPGETVRFRIDIDPDDPDAFPHPDFRRVLFDMNGNDPSDNSRMELHYSDGLIGTGRLDDYPVNPLAGIFVSFEQANIRPYSWMEPVEVFELSDRTVIPEPSTWSIAVLALAAAGLWSRRRRASGQA